MKRQRKALAAIVCIAMILGALAGCTQSPSATASPAPAAATAPAESTAPEEILSPPPTMAPAKIVFWSPMYDQSSSTDIARSEWYISKSIQRFEDANPGLTVEYVPQPYENMVTLYKTASLAGNGPDLYMSSVGYQTYPNNEFFEPLNDYFTAAELDQLTGMQYCYKNFDSNQMLYGIPIYQNMILVYYNIKLFAQAGFSADTQFKDKDELFEACQKLLDTGILPFAIGDNNGYTSDWGPETWVLSQLGPQFTIDAIMNKTNYSCPELINSFKAWNELYEKGYCNKDAASLSPGDADTMFLAEKSAMVIDGSWGYVSYSKAMGDNLGIMLFPSYNASDPYADCLIGSPDACICLSNYSKNKQQAVMFIKHLVSKDEQMQYSKDRGYFPNITNVDVSELTGTDANFQKMLGYLNTGKVYFYMFDLQAKEITDFYLRLCPLVLSGKMTAEDFAKQIDDKKATVKSVFSD
jgi:ABC-type glycerol-3-phosphate transport system substrate-binding protein